MGKVRRYLLKRLQPFPTHGRLEICEPSHVTARSGKVRDDAVAVAGAVFAHRRMPLSLSFDHRCITGGEACRFLAAVITDLEKPE